MTKKIYHFVSHYPCSLICITLIWVLSLTPFFPETPLDDVAFIDKWTHLVMYGGTCSVMWWEHVRHTHLSGRRQTIHFSLLTILFLVALGGLMELLQAHCTTTRSGRPRRTHGTAASPLHHHPLGRVARFLGRQSRRRVRNPRRTTY